MRASNCLKIGFLRAWLATLLAGSFACGIVQGARLDFEGVPLDYHYDGGGLNLGSYYVGQPAGPIFGPQTSILAKGGGSLNAILYPPSSGQNVLWGFNQPIEVWFSTGLAYSVSLYYRSNSDLYLYAFDLNDVLLGSTGGAASLGPDGAPGFLSYDAGAEAIARVLIQDSGKFFVIDDFSYRTRAVSEPEAVMAQLFVALGFGALLMLGAPRRWKGSG